MRLTTSDIKSALSEAIDYYPDRDKGIIADRVHTTIELRQAEWMKIIGRLEY